MVLPLHLHQTDITRLYLYRYCFAFHTLLLYSIPLHHPSPPHPTPTPTPSPSTNQPHPNPSLTKPSLNPIFLWKPPCHHPNDDMLLNPLSPTRTLRTLAPSPRPPPRAPLAPSPRAPFPLRWASLAPLQGGRPAPLVVTPRRYYTQPHKRGPISDKLKRLTQELVRAVKEGNALGAEAVWKRVQKDRLPLDAYLFSAALGLFALRRDRDRALSLKHAYEDQSGPLDSAGYSSLLRLAVHLDDALLLIETLEEMDRHGVALLHHDALKAMHYLSHQRDFIKSFYLLSRMLANNLLDTKAFDLVLSTAQSTEECYAIYNKMQALQCAPSRDTYDIILRNMIKTGEVEKMFDFYKGISEKGLVGTGAFNVLLLSSQNSARRTVFFWEEMKRFGVARDVESFNFMIKVLALHGEIGAIRELLVEMKELGVSANHKTSFILRKFSLPPL
eukprot:TRINITY_DN3743_c0_g3_i1.p1 TRINITY_DN3743_c0_g3~~TRINITY_DN3743_c0_g3_i1.p1  ORF type:complete len:444 (-),score=87.94 TRINITY_DN3743_c0_g3_i1:44-1375(-)